MAQFETDSPEVSESYICIHCSHPVSSLYITYPNPSNTSLLQCPAQCGNLADVYTTLTFPVLLVDLLLFKPRVYRHLLCNRGPRDSEQRARGRTESLWRVGGVVIGLDAYIRCANVGPPQSLHPLRLFARTLGYCLLETVSLHGCIALSALLIQSFFAPPKGSRPPSSLRLLPLTLFYTSLPTLFLLCISSLIWPDEYALQQSPASGPSTHPDLSTVFAPLAGLLHSLNPTTTPILAWVLEKLSWLSRENLHSGVSRVGGWANEAVLRKGVGGSSAVVGVSVLLNASKRRTALVLVLAWILHLGVLHVIDPWLT